jgi:hypothetical protein
LTIPANNLSSDSVFRRSPQVASRTIAGKAVLMKAPISSLNTLNKVGGFIWDCLEEPRSIDGLSTLVSEKFKVSKEQANADIALFIKNLLLKDLVERAEEETR